MKRLLLILSVVLLATSCGSGRKALYYWGGKQKGTTAYENLAFQRYDKETPQSLCNMVCVYEEMISNPGGMREVPPPGICAEYGYLLLQPQTAHIFAQYATNEQRAFIKSANYSRFFYERGKEMLEKEMELYPESITYLKPLAEKLLNK